MKKQMVFFLLVFVLCCAAAALPVQADAQLSIDQADYASGATIVVTYTGVTAEQEEAKAWVAVAQSGAPASSYLDWQYVQQGAGTVKLEAPGDNGFYEVRFYQGNTANDENLMRDCSVSFTVNGGQPAAILYPETDEFDWELVTFAKGSGTWDGVFETKYGPLALAQTEDGITGRYPAWDNGKVAGVVTDGVLFGCWYEAPGYAPPDDAGQIVLVMHEDGQSFTGWWRYGDSGAWGLWSAGSRLEFTTSDWAAGEVALAAAYHLLPESLYEADFTQDMTRAEFAAVAVKLYEALSGTQAALPQDHPFSDTEDGEVLKAYHLGIVSGVSEAVFDPDGYISREEAAVMLTRAYKCVFMPDWTLDTDAQFQLQYTKPALFADDAAISSWAKDSVYFMTANNILQGMGNGRFVPNNAGQNTQDAANITREQALAVAARMYETWAPDMDITVPQEPVLPPEDMDNVFLQQIPAYHFGTLADTKADQYGATITITGATMEDYEAYTASIAGQFPQNVNSLDGPTPFVIKTNGTYTITVSFDGETITISVEAAE